MTLDKHRIPGSVDKHLPDFRGDSVDIDQGTITNLDGTDLQYELVNTEEANNKRDARRLAQSGSGSQSDPYVIDNTIFDGAKTVRVPSPNDDTEAWFETDGLQFPSFFDWNVTNVNLVGDGVRNATIILADSAGLTTSDGMIEWPAVDGNFGSIKGLRLHGNKSNNSSGNIIYKPSGNVMIDTVIDDCIIRYGAHRGVVLAGASGGTRIRNSWIENCDDDGLNIGIGGRMKITDNHILSNGRYGMITECFESSLKGNTYWGNDSRALWLAGNDNILTNEHIKHDGSNEAVRIAGSDNLIRGMRIMGTSADMVIGGDGNEIDAWIGGDVTINGDNNDLTKSRIDGTVTDNGTGNDW